MMHHKGVASAPLVLAAAIFVVWQGWKGDWDRRIENPERLNM